VFSARTLTSSEARLIGEAYLRAGRNPNKVGEALGMREFDKELLAHPLVRREVRAIARIHSQNYSMSDHMEKLAQIRDAALDDGKYTAALGAELAIGKASGLYDKGVGDEDENDPAIEPTKLSTTQIREMLAKREVAEQHALPAPDTGNQLDDDSVAADVEEDLDPIYEPPSDMNEDGLP
jgi:hypothetical protein